ncbi:MAG: winged helix-turn-helix domain-containing protein [Deltaproteobacteria bacterium]|nr:winged helix-turn-helix domain-containing protein [Deltaproteobacteria bacterium]
MTFLEAAIEVLREADGPLHFTEVAKRAVDGNLLSHVGRDPEAAMRSCLMSAARQGVGAVDPLIVRDKPGVYGLRPGAPLPDPPARPAPSPRAKASKKSSKSAGSVAEAKASDEGTERKRRRRTKARGEAPAPVSVEVLPVRKTTKTKTKTKAKSKAKKTRSRSASAATAPTEAPEVAAVEPASEAATAEQTSVEFEAPSGSGLDGVTDVALVMANAMSRLVVERPELRDELDAMQQTNEDDAPEAAENTPPPRAREDKPERSSRSDRSERSERSERGHHGSRSNSAPREEERGGRRRRRRRRRGKRVDWSAGVNARSAAESMHDTLLDNVATVLEEAGSRSLHVRQIAETLAGKGVLGGEISEIERAVTAAVLLDVGRLGRTSRFSARGDARYQLQGTRLPDKAAKAEQAVRAAARTLEIETQAQIIQWLQSLGARALESLVRIYLHRESFTLLSALPPSRGLGKLVVEDPDPEYDEPKLLVLVVPRRTALEAKAWDGEVERNQCGGVLIFAMGDLEEGVVGEARVINAQELAHWLSEQQVGIGRLTIDVPVIDATFIESIGGLDT